MSIITKMLKQKAVYWPPTGTDTRGQPTWGVPVELKARWEGELQNFMEAGWELDFADNEPPVVVFVEEVSPGVEVEVKGVLLEGPLGSSVNTTDPKANTGAREIRKFNRLPNFKATEFLRTAYL